MRDLIKKDVITSNIQNIIDDLQEYANSLDDEKAMIYENINRLRQTKATIHFYGEPEEEKEK
jgi:prefoldin subunit 5